MKKVNIAELEDATIKTLVQASAVARQRAYMPYSNFSVGAALLCEDGTVFTGCNVENVSYGLTICAERTAIVKAVSEGKTNFKRIAISAVNKDLLVSPCGACRQFIQEFASTIEIYLYNPDTQQVGITDLAILFPYAVKPDNLQCVLATR